MNFEALKMGFFSYLEEKLNGDANSKQEPIQNSAISVFMYSDEFKDYLVEEVGADSSIFSKSINEIMQMDFVNGKLVEPAEEIGDTFESENETEPPKTAENSDFMTNIMNEFFADENVINTLDADASGDLDMDEVGAFYQNIGVDNENGEVTFDDIAMGFQSIQNGEYQTDEEKSPVDLLLDKVYDNKTVIKTIDIDGDGILNDEEKAKFEEYIKGYDKNSNGELTEEAIKCAFDDIMAGKFSYDNDLTTQEEIPEIETETPTVENTETQTPVQNTSQSAPMSSSGGNIGGSSSPTGSSNVNTPQGIEGMTLEELESEKTKQESKVSDARDAVNDVHSGENSAVKEAEESCEEAKAAYDEAIENDENISEDLKNQRDENLEAIEAKETEINDLNVSINNQEGLISEQESNISSTKSNISALNSSLSSLPSSDDPEKQQEIEQKRSEIKDAISKAEKELKKQEEKLEELNTDLKTMQDDLQTAEGELKELETAKSDIESQILEVCGTETKEAMQKYNEAKENVSTVKESELKKAEGNLETEQKALDEINTQIDAKKAEETQKENRVSSANGQELLDELSALGMDLSKLSNELGMSQEETAAYLTELCESEEWAGGCIEPIVLYGQIMQESGFDADILGDSGAALGLGQFHKCAVDEVNNRYGTNYTYEDRSNPKKALEMMALLLKYDYSCTGSQNGMLAMYNQGHASAINESGGQAYVKHVLARIGRTP